MRHLDRTGIDVESLAGKTIIVTGAGAGIGRGVAIGAADSGANVVLVDIDGASVKSLAVELDEGGRTAVPATADVTIYEQFSPVVDDTIDRFGRLDGLVAAVGGFPGRIPAQDISLDQWEEGITLNLSSAFYSCRAVMPQMISQQSGSIVLVSSAAGRTIANRCTAYYAAAKSGILGLARHLAYELGEHGVRVNAVAPGTTMTPRIEKLYDEARLDTIRAKTPLGRIAEVEDQVGPALFLLSDASAYMTGTTLDVSGGRIMM